MRDRTRTCARTDYAELFCGPGFKPGREAQWRPGIEPPAANRDLASIRFLKHRREFSRGGRVRGAADRSRGEPSDRNQSRSRHRAGTMLGRALLTACCYNMLLVSRAAVGGAIHVEPSLPEVAGTEGRSVSINCTDVGFGFSWFLIPDHEECKSPLSSHDAEQQVNTSWEGGRCSLTISRLRFTDSGIVILQSKRGTSDGVKIRLRVSPDCHATARVIVDPPGPVTPSSNLSLTCQLDRPPGAPGAGPRVAWTFNERPVPSEGNDSSSPVRVVDSGLRVEITNVQARHQGEWRCAALDGRAASTFCLTFSTTDTSSRWRCPDPSTAATTAARRPSTSETQGARSLGAASGHGPGPPNAQQALPLGLNLLVGAVVLVLLSSVMAFVLGVRRARATRDKGRVSVIGPPRLPHHRRFRLAVQDSDDSDAGDEERLYAAAGSRREHPEPVYAVVRPHPRGAPRTLPEAMWLVSTHNQDTFYGDGGLIRVNPIYRAMDLEENWDYRSMWRPEARLCYLQDNPAYESLDSVHRTELPAASDTRGRAALCEPEEFSSQECIYEVLRI